MYSGNVLCFQSKKLLHIIPKIAKLCSSQLGEQLPKKTALFDFHLSKRGKMVTFCGYSLPQQYEGQTIIESHCFVRENCGLFDVSHMLQTKIEGLHRREFIESLSCANLIGSNPGLSTLSVFLNENGGIMDDFIVCNCKEPYLYLVSNAVCSTKISNHLTTQMNSFLQQGKEVKVSFMERSLIALQGPKASSILGAGIASPEKSKFAALHFMESAQFSSLFDLRTSEEADPGFRVTRCGYTGEDGYEISVANRVASQLADRILEQGGEATVRPIGLAARDTLRLEAGLCLYGNELSERESPVEAGLAWLIGKRRRQSAQSAPFPGHENVLAQLAPDAVLKKTRVGLTGAFGPQPRNGFEIFTTSTKQQVGTVTSGCLSPSLGHNIAMAYVRPDFADRGQQLMVKVRKKFYPFTVTTLPFVPSRYVRRVKPTASASAAT